MTDEIPEHFTHIYTEERFWQRFHPAGECIHYNYATPRDANGLVKYAPKIRWMGQTFYVVRVAALYGGLIDSIDAHGQIRHTCGDSGCFKPDHLRYHPSPFGKNLSPEERIAAQRAQRDLQRPVVSKFTADKLWPLIDMSERATECWLPKHPRHHSGQVYWDGRTRRIARIAAFYSGLLRGLNDKRSLRWTCDNCLCCNPKHIVVFDYAPVGQDATVNADE